LRGAAIERDRPSNGVSVAARIPEISIGLPVRNGERYLRAAIEDFIGQSHADWELIVSDNASTDATEEIARDFAARDGRIRYHRNEFDTGGLANANWTVELASGRYFCLAAYDDRHASDFLGRLVDPLRADPGAVLAYGGCERIGARDERLRYDSSRRAFVAPDGEAYPGDPDLERPMPDDPAARYAAVLASGSVDAPMHGLFRMRTLRAMGGQKVYGSDRLIVARAALAGRFAFVDAPLFRFRIHEGSTLHLSEEERLQREAPGVDPRGRRARTLAAYLAAVTEARLTPAQRMRALAATAAYAARRAAHPPLESPPAAREPLHVYA
jgi:glycosyltransferase involved in cell wall biosynthesis